LLPQKIKIWHVSGKYDNDHFLSKAKMSWEYILW
jgi:hypothetical protein